MSGKKTVRKKLSRTQQRDLDVQIAFMEGLVRRDPGYVDALQILGDNYTRRGQYAEGLRIDEQLANLRPEDALVHYNLACSLSLTSRYDEAAVALERALELGYRDFRWLARDPDLAALRKAPVYKRLRAQIRLLRAQESTPR